MTRITACALVCGCALQAESPRPASRAKESTTRPAPIEEETVAGNNRFALELYAKLRGEPSNLFCSPYSISTALAMAYAGARGPTADEMAEVMHFSPPGEALHQAMGALIADLNARGEEKPYELLVANALWGEKSMDFLPTYTELLKTHYRSSLHEVDFRGATEEARQTINAWVEEQTKDKIKELIKPGILNRDTRLVLTNAIYFKGQWELPFKKDATRDEPFTRIGGEKVTVPMMHQTDSFRYMEDEKLQVLELPYAGEDLAMTVLLPRKMDGLSDLEKALTPGALKGWLKGLRMQKVVVSLPSFEMTSEFELGKVLKAMGMGRAFSNADFSGMTGDKDLAISEVVHKAYVKVNEEGTEAAAATAVMMRATAVMPTRTPEFKADHPFLFLIRDVKTNSILFVGRVMDPKASQ
jgi:serpin B